MPLRKYAIGKRNILEVFPLITERFDHNSETFSLIDRIIVIGLMGLIVGATLAFGAVEPWSLAMLETLVITLLVIWGIRSALLGELKIIIPSTALPILALLILALAQDLFFSLDAEATRLAAELLLILFIAFLLFSNFLAAPRTLPWLRNFLIFFGLAMAIFGLIQHFTWNGKFFWVVKLRMQPPSPFGPFVNHNNFAGFLEMIAPFPMVLILRRVVRGGLALLYGFAAAMMGLAIVLSLSRGGMLSFVASLMFVVVFGFNTSRSRSAAVSATQAHSRNRRSRSSFPIPITASRIFAIVLMVFTIGVGAWWIGVDPLVRSVEKSELSLDATGDHPGKETFYQSRGWIWRDTAAMIRSHWVTGVGLGAFPTAYPIYSASNGATVTSQAHNDYLQIMADAGIFGAIIALWFIFLIARDTVRALRRGNQMMAATALGAASGVFALMVHSLFDFNLQIPSNTLLFLALTACVSRIAADARRGDGNVSERNAAPSRTRQAE